MDATRRSESVEEALHRLCQKGHDQGLQLLDRERDWFPFACRVTGSAGDGTTYVVNLAPGPLHGCDCEGYERWQRCKHYAMALEAAGWLPDLPDAAMPSADDALEAARPRRVVKTAEDAAREAERMADYLYRREERKQLESAAEGAIRERESLAAMSRDERRAAAAADMAARQEGAAA